jgi:hypothetical protein
MEDLSAVPIPAGRGCYVSLPYVDLVTQVHAEVRRVGLMVDEERYALSRSGARMAGCITCGERTDKEWSLVIGLRSSYDGSIAPCLVVGSHVWSCDNIAFHEVIAPFKRRQTLGLFRDLISVAAGMVASANSAKIRVAAGIDAMRERTLDERAVRHLVGRAVEGGAITAGKVSRVRERYVEMRPEIYGDCTAWCLFNSFTVVMGDDSPWRLMRNTLRLTNVFLEGISQTG